LNFGQTIWDKIEVQLGTPQGPSWELGEPKRVMMIKYWEHIEKKEEK
jgi:hypothetical protein